MVLFPSGIVTTVCYQLQELSSLCIVSLWYCFHQVLLTSGIAWYYLYVLSSLGVVTLWHCFFQVLLTSGMVTIECYYLYVLSSLGVIARFLLLVD